MPGGGAGGWGGGARGAGGGPRHGRDARIIGRVVADHPGRVVVRTPVGGHRILDMPVGDPIPRIC